MCRVEGQHDGLTIELLGRLVVARDGLQQALPGSRKTRALLAYLALTRRAHPRDALCALLWEGARDPRAELRWSLAKIRAAVGPSLEISPDGVALGREGVSVDAMAFRAIAERPVTEAAVSAALALWRGTPLADVDVELQPTFQAWLAAERDALGALRTALLRTAVDGAWSQPDEALAAARRLVANEPWSEWGHARVVQLLERCGRPAEAADYLFATRLRLSRELALPEADVFMRLPPPPRVETVATRTAPAPRARPVLRVERIQAASAGAPAEGIATHLHATLVALLWRRACCEVVDAEMPVRAQHEGAANPEFAVRGSVVRDGDVAFLSLRLTRLSLGTLVWSMQTEVRAPTLSGVSAWVGEAIEAMAAAIDAAGPATQDPNDTGNRLLRATELAGALDVSANREAIQLLDGILAEDADDPTTLALASWCHAQRAVYNWSGNPERERQEARRYAAAATRDGIDDPKVLTTIATARTLVKEGNAAQVLLERSLRLDKRSPLTHARSGWLANFSDRPEDAVRHFRTAIRLAPLAPTVFNAYAGLGAAHFIQGDHARAVQRMEQALALNPRALWIHRNLVPAYVAVGDRRGAEDGVTALTKGYPRLTVSDVVEAVVFSPPVLARMGSGLHEAGLPA